MPELSRARRELEFALRTERAQRRETDPLHLWVPTERQAPFVSSVLSGDKMTNYLVAANRSGKSDAGAACAAHLARFGVDPIHAAYSEGGRVAVYDRATSGWVVTLDFPTSRDIVQPKLFDNKIAKQGSHPPFIPDREIARDGWRSADQILRLKVGSIIGFKSGESGRVKFQGAGKDWIWFDEEPDKGVADEAAIRVEAGRRLRIFYTCTILPPEGQVGGVSWIFSEIIQPWQSGQKPNLGVFGASIYDNPHIEPPEIDRLEAMYPEGSVQRRIRLGGEWLPGLAGARAYPGFQRTLHVAPQPPIMPRLPLCWFWDFNVAPMVSGFGQKLGRVFHIYRELVLEEGNVPDMVDWFREVVPSHRAEVWIYGDSTGKGRDPSTGKSDYQIIQNGMRAYPAPVRLRVPEINPGVVDRINAVNHACKDETGEVLLEVDPSCKELIADLEQVLRDVRGRIRKTNNRGDPYFRRTHISDALGYWIATDSPIRALSDTTKRPVVAVPDPAYAWSV
jgi:phage terminase large subunit-like protein